MSPNDTDGSPSRNNLTGIFISIIRERGQRSSVVDKQWQLPGQNYTFVTAEFSRKCHGYHRQSFIDVLLFTLLSTSILLSISYISANVGLFFGSVFQHLVIIS